MSCADHQFENSGQGDRKRCTTSKLRGRRTRDRVCCGLGHCVSPPQPSAYRRGARRSGPSRQGCCGFGVPPTPSAGFTENADTSSPGCQSQEPAESASCAPSDWTHLARGDWLWCDGRGRSRDDALSPTSAEAFARPAIRCGCDRRDRRARREGGRPPRSPWRWLRTVSSSWPTSHSRSSSTSPRRVAGRGRGPNRRATPAGVNSSGVRPYGTGRANGRRRKPRRRRNRNDPRPMDGPD
jgi:hypothetical protein